MLLLSYRDLARSMPAQNLHSLGYIQAERHKSRDAAHSRGACGRKRTGPVPRGLCMPLRYNPAFGFRLKRKIIMEAERINAIGNKIADLAARGTELRRYL